MRVENILNDLNLNNKQAQNLLQQLQTSARQTKGEKGPRNSSQIILQLIQENLEPRLQKLFLQTWAQLQLPLKEKQITQLINFLNSNQELPSETVIKAGGFLAQNNLLETSPALLQDILLYLNNSTTLTEELSSLLNKIPDEGLNGKNAGQQETATTTSTNSPAEPQSLSSEAEAILAAADPKKSAEQNTQISELKNLLSKLVIPLNHSTEDIKHRLQEYQAGLKQLFSLAAEATAEKTNNNEQLKNILGHLRGQQALNFQNQTQQTELLLMLEIPLFFHENQSLSPLHLQIFKQNSGSKSEEDDKTSFKICFVIELPELGAIKAEVVIQNKLIKPRFLSENQQARQLIAKNFELLSEKLLSLGYNVSSPSFEMMEDKLAGEEQLSSMTMINTSIDTSSAEGTADSEQYQSINFLI